MKLILKALCLSMSATVAFAQEPMTNWSGGYAGVQFGYLDSDFDHDYSQTSVTFNSTASLNASGALGGLYGGYNWQSSGPWVYGVEGEYNWADASGNANEVSSDPGTLGTYETSIDATAAIRGRVGYASGRNLFYGTIGMAYIDFKSRYDNPLPAAPSQDLSDSRIGWTIGVGWERDVGNQWVGRVDYRYSDFGDDTYLAGSGPPNFKFSGQVDTSEIRVGIARRF